MSLYNNIGLAQMCKFSNIHLYCYRSC